MTKFQKSFFTYAKNTEWDSAKLSNKTLEEEVLEFKQSPQAEGKNVYIGSRSLILQLMKLNLIDEYQLCVYPVIAGSGLPLFENLHDRTIFKLNRTKIFSGGAVTLYYTPKMNN